MNCKFCGKAFSRGFNLRRHENEYCPLKIQDREESESSQTMDSEDDASTTSTDWSQSSPTTDNELETEGKNDPWMPMVEEAMQKHKATFEDLKRNLIYKCLDKQSAGQKAYSDILPILQKDLENIYKDRLLWMKHLKSDPVHKKIMQTKNNFVNNDHFDQEEAMEAAVEKRKFRIKKLLIKDYTFTEDNDDEDN